MATQPGIRCRPLLAALPILAAACTVSTHGRSTAEAETGTTDASTTGPDEDETTQTSTSSDPATSTSGTGSDESGQPPIFDLPVPDGGVEPGGDNLPTTCADAQIANSTVGCTFFAADLDQEDSLETAQFAVAVANVQSDQQAAVIVEKRGDGGWEPAADPVDVAPGDVAVFELAEGHQEQTGLQEGGAYRVTADVPVIAYQFNPLVASAQSSDASMLYPVPSWDTLAHVVGYRSWHYYGDNYMGAYATIIAATDGTQVEVTPSVATMAGLGIPAGEPQVPFTIELDEGDVASIMVESPEGATLTGTRIEASDPVAVFSGHECALIPIGMWACDHLEEQIPGLRLWGMEFVAARMPVRRNDGYDPEPTLWQVYASEDDTTVSLVAAPEVTGLPDSPVVLQAGELLEFEASGVPGQPGDFYVAADRPVAVTSYMVASDAASPHGGHGGDPAMLSMAPVEQYLARYVVLVPQNWLFDYALITRPLGVPVQIDGVPVDEAAFAEVGASHEVARVLIDDGVHVIEGDAPFGVAIVGYGSFDSYAYLGGVGTALINPTPEG